MTTALTPPAIDMPVTSPRWWGCLAHWEHIDDDAYHMSTSVGAVTVTIRRDALTRGGRHAWFLTSPSSSMSGAFLSTSDRQAVMMAETLLTEAVARCITVADAVDRIDGMPTLMHAVGEQSGRETPLTGDLSAWRHPCEPVWRIGCHDMGSPSLVAYVRPLWLPHGADVAPARDLLAVSTAGLEPGRFFAARAAHIAGIVPTWDVQWNHAEPCRFSSWHAAVTAVCHYYGTGA